MYKWTAAKNLNLWTRKFLNQFFQMKVNWLSDDRNLFKSWNLSSIYASNHLAPAKITALKSNMLKSQDLMFCLLISHGSSQMIIFELLSSKSINLVTWHINSFITTVRHSTLRLKVRKLHSHCFSWQEMSHHSNVYLSGLCPSDIQIQLKNWCESTSNGRSLWWNHIIGNQRD